VRFRVKRLSFAVVGRRLRICCRALIRPDRLQILRAPWAAWREVRRSRERALVRAAAVDDRNRNIQQPEIYRKLTAMVVPVIQHD